MSERSGVEALVERWRKCAAMVDKAAPSFELQAAGWNQCADELEAALRSQPAPPDAIPLTAEMAEKIWKDVKDLVTLECGCIVDGNTVTLCAKHYANWRNSLAAAPARAGQLSIEDAVETIGGIALKGTSDFCPGCNRELGYIFYANEVREVILAALSATRGSEQK